MGRNPFSPKNLKFDRQQMLRDQIASFEGAQASHLAKTDTYLNTMHPDVYQAMGDAIESVLVDLRQQLKELENEKPNP